VADDATRSNVAALLLWARSNVPEVKGAKAPRRWSGTCRAVSAGPGLCPVYSPAAPATDSTMPEVVRTAPRHGGDRACVVGSVRNRLPGMPNGCGAETIVRVSGGGLTDRVASTHPIFALRLALVSGSWPVLERGA
jgi:hypothetical protein